MCRVVFPNEAQEFYYLQPEDYSAPSFAPTDIGASAELPKEVLPAPKNDNVSDKKATAKPAAKKAKPKKPAPPKVTTNQKLLRLRKEMGVVYQVI